MCGSSAEDGGEKRRNLSVENAKKRLSKKENEEEEKETDVRMRMSERIGKNEETEATMPLNN